MASNDKNYQRMIQSQRWTRLRRWKLTECPLCERCHERGILTAASEVHHRYPVEEGLSVSEMQRLMFAVDNLMSVCHPCHVQLHIDMKSKSKEVTQMRNEKKLARFRAKFLGEGV